MVATFDDIFKLLNIIMSYFGSFFDILFTDVWTLLTKSFVGEILPDFYVKALQTLNIDTFLGSFTLAGLLFSFVVIAFIIIRFIVPFI